MPTDAVPTLPTSPLALCTLELVRSSESPSIANHSVRSYLFAALMADHRGIESGNDFDPEILFLACVLHDIGLCDAGNREQRFEVDGADMAAEFLTAQGLSAIDVDQVWDAIALHTSPHIAERKGPVALLTRAGVGGDFGRDVGFIADVQAAEITAAYPRLAMARTLADEIIAQAVLQPAKAPPYSLAASLMRERDTRGSTTLEDGEAASRWSG